MSEVSATRLYLGNLPRNVTKGDIENHFAAHGSGKIVEVKLMNGFGFIEYEDAMDARDVVPAYHGTDFNGQRLTVQFARGSRPSRGGAEGGGYGHPERTAPRPRRTIHRMTITGLPAETSWQDLKDFARKSGLDVVYSETGRDSGGRGFVEFETAADLTNAVEKLDGQDFKGQRVQCIVDTQAEVPRGRDRSRSPRRYGGPPRGGYSPRHDPGFGGRYRERSPRGRDDYYGRPGDYRSSRDDYRGRGDYPPHPPPPADPYARMPRDYPPPPPREPYHPQSYPPRDPRADPRGDPRADPRGDPYAPRDPGYPPRDGYPRDSRDFDRRYW